MISDFKKISQQLQLDLKDISKSLTQDFPLLVPEHFVARMAINDLNDPLLLQVLPTENELKDTPGFNFDPFSEKSNSPIKGLIHKYQDRVLLLVTNNCAINCRFCFRRHMQVQVENWEAVFKYIENDSAITEVILSGGDPLVLDQEELQKIIDNLSDIKHIKRIRIHSRIPIVSPEKITDNFVQSKAPVVLVVHCNHPNEIDDAVVEAIKKIKKQNIIIFNQSVLLKNINDDVETLISLNEKLFNMGVIPYYLHMLDKVKGATHFYIDEKKAKEIYLELQKVLPGYLVPKLVIEQADGKIYV